MKKLIVVFSFALLSSFSAFSQNCHDQYVNEMDFNWGMYQIMSAFCDYQYGFNTTYGVNCKTLALQTYSMNDQSSYSTYMRCLNVIALKFEPKGKKKHRKELDV
jgi:hypothetical protein